MGQHRSVEQAANVKWSIGFSAAIAVLFVLYEWIVPASPRPVQDFVRGWFSVSNTNEMLIYVIMAIGLNIVVGYAGLLDLGFVAFWAIGGYVAGWLMSSFFTDLEINIFGNPPVGQEYGIHITF